MAKSEGNPSPPDAVSLVSSHRSLGIIPKRRRKIGPRHELTTAQKSDMKKAFDSFDLNGLGWIRIEELRVAVRALGFEPKMQELRAMVSCIDKEGKGKISFDDFLHLMAIKMSERDTKPDILKAFRLIDTRGCERIRFLDLRKVAAELGENLNDEELLEMIKEADTDNDNAVTVDDFIKLTKKYGGLKVITNPND